MPSKTVFIDHEENEMEWYINGAGLLHMEVSSELDEPGHAFMTMDKMDVQKLIRMLTEIEKDMKD
jgi:hypothetical protein